MKQSLNYWNLGDYTHSLSEYLEYLINLGHRIDNVMITNYATEFRRINKENKQEYMFATKAIVVTSCA